MAQTTVNNFKPKKSGQPKFVGSLKNRKISQQTYLIPRVKAFKAFILSFSSRFTSYFLVPSLWAFHCCFIALLSTSIAVQPQEMESCRSWPHGWLWCGSIIININDKLSNNMIYKFKQIGVNQALLPYNQCMAKWSP